MKTVFADTFYFLALWNAQDARHSQAVEFTEGYHERIFSTDWVITELADALARPPSRARFLHLYRLLQQQKELAIIPATRSLLEDGLGLYESRPDKEWSLTDFISFVVMQKEGIHEALTGDRHFEQAGFAA